MTFLAISPHAIIAMILTLLLSQYSYAGQNNNVTPTEAEQLIALSGFAGLLKQLPQHFSQGISDASRLNKTTTKNKQQLLDKSQQALIAAGVRQHIARSVSRALTQDDLAQLMTWYNSRAGKHISTAQAHAVSEEGFSAMMTQVNDLLTKPALLNLAEVMDKQLNFSEFIVDLQEYQAFAEYSTLASLQGKVFNIDQFDKRMKRQREQMRFNAEQLVLVSLAYAFCNVNKQDVQAYEYFLQQPLTQRYLKAAMRGLEIGMQQMVKNWLREVNLQVASE